MVVRQSAGLVKLVGLCATAGVLVAAVMLPVVGGIGLASNQATDAVDQVSGDLAKGELPLMTTIQDRDGNTIAQLYDQYRVPTELSKISKEMQAAIIAVEDKRFYDHDGVDWTGIERAAAKAVSGGDLQGASTLTQQYVKNYTAFVIGKGDDKAYQKATEATPGRKLKEARIAIQLEQRLRAEGKSTKEVKDEILAGYLNIVPLGNGTFGVGAAAHTYFGITPDKLDVPQSALLVMLANYPTLLDPGKPRDNVLKRRNALIDTMRDNGMFGPDKEEARKAADGYKEKGLGVPEKIQPPQSGCVGNGNLRTDGFFCSYLLSYLAKAGLSTEQLSRGGYTVKTTLDRKANDAAKEAAAQQAPPRQTPGIANVMSVVEPGTDKHKVRALAANKDFGNDADAGQTAYELPSEVTGFGAGSIYKVFTSAAALERHETGIYKQLDNPSTYTSDRFKNGGGPYTVKNFSDTYPKQMTLQDALAQSPNTAFVKLEEKIGVPAVVDMATKLGMRDTMQGVNSSGQTLKADGSNGPSQGEQFKRDNAGSLTLGPGATSVLELANVAATLMSGGVYCPPTPVESVTDRDGKPVALKEQGCAQVVSKELANTLVVGMSKDDKPGGTSAGAANTASWGDRPILGKTGTTETSQSVAFMAATPQFAGAVMTFSDGVRPQTICKNPLRLCGDRQNGGVVGGDVAAPTWYRAMKVIHEGLPALPLPQADPSYS